MILRRRHVIIEPMKTKMTMINLIQIIQVTNRITSPYNLLSLLTTSATFELQSNPRPQIASVKYIAIMIYPTFYKVEWFDGLTLIRPYKL